MDSIFQRSWLSFGVHLMKSVSCYSQLLVVLVGHRLFGAGPVAPLEHYVGGYMLHLVPYSKAKNIPFLEFYRNLIFKM